jgi:hypothetical protein
MAFTKVLTTYQIYHNILHTALLTRFWESVERDRKLDKLWLKCLM